MIRPINGLEHTTLDRWFYNRDQNNESDHDKCITPACMQGIKQLLRKETSPYKPSDIWTNEDQALFLKYCPEKRDKYYHAMANDTLSSSKYHLQVYNMQRFT